MFLRFNGPFDICITLVSFDNLKVSVGKSGYSSLYEQLNKCGWDEASSSTQNCEYPCSTFSTNLLAPRCMEQMLKAHMSAVVAIVLTFQAADLWDTPVIRFFCRCWVPWSIHPFEFRRCSALRSSLYKLFQPRPQLTKDSHLAARIPFPSTSIFAPSMSPNEKQAAKVLSPAMTTPTWTRDPKIDIGVAAA